MCLGRALPPQKRHATFLFRFRKGQPTTEAYLFTSSNSMAEDVIQERQAKTEHFRQHCHGRAKQRSACRGIWYENDPKTLSRPRGCLLNHYNNRDLLRDTRTRGGGLGENTKTLPSQTQESLFCQFFSLAVFIEAYNVYNGYFSGPGRKVFGQNWKEQCDLAFSLSSPSRSGRDELTSLQVNMNLHGNYWHRRRKGQEVNSDTNKNKKRNNRNKSNGQTICRWYCPRQRWKELYHLNETFSQQFMSAVHISASCDKTYHSLDSHLFSEQGCQLAWEEDFWPRIGLRIKAMSHSANCQRTLLNFCQTFYERLCEKMQEKTQQPTSPRPSVAAAGSPLKNTIDLTLKECDFELACQFWPRWCETSRIQEYLQVQRAAAAAEKNQECQQQQPPKLFDPRKHRLWRKLLMNRDKFDVDDGEGGTERPLEQFLRQMNLPPTSDFSHSNTTSSSSSSSRLLQDLQLLSDSPDAWSSAESDDCWDDFEQELELKKIKLSMGVGVGPVESELAHTCYRELEFVQKPVQLQTRKRQQPATRGKKLKESYWLLLEKEIRNLQIWADFFLPRDFRDGMDGAGFPAGSSLDALVDKCHEFVQLGCQLKELCFGACLAVLQLADLWLDLRRDCLLDILAEGGTKGRPGTGLDVHGLDYPVDAGLMLDFAERIDVSLYTDEKTQRGDSFKRELARDLTRARPCQLKFFFTTFSECELFHVRHCPDPANIRLQFLRQLGEFLTASCHDLDLAGDGPAQDNDHWINSYLFDLSSSMTVTNHPPQLKHRSIKSYLAQCFPIDSVVNMDKDFILNRNRMSQGEFTRYICRRIPNLLDKKFQADLAGVVSIVSGRTDATPLSSGLPRSHWGFCQSRSRITYESLGNFTRFQSFLSQTRVYENEDKLHEKVKEEENDSCPPPAPATAAAAQVDDDVSGPLAPSSSSSSSSSSHAEDDDDLTSDRDAVLRRRKLSKKRASQQERSLAQARRERRNLIDQVTRRGGQRRLMTPIFLTPEDANNCDRATGHVYLSSSEGENDDEKELIRKINSRDMAKDEDRAARRKVYDKYFKPSLVKKLGDGERTLLKNSFDDDKCSSLSLIYFSFLVNFCGLHGFKIMHAALFFNKPYLNEYLYKIVNARWNIRHDPQMALKSMVLKTVRADTGKRNIFYIYI